MNKRFSSTALALITLASCSDLHADGEVGKGALVGGLAGAAIGGMAGGSRGAGIGAAAGLGLGLLGGSIAKSERHQREDARMVHYTTAPRPSRYALEQEIESLNEENDALRDQVSQLQRVVTTKKQRIAALDAQVENLQIQNQELREDIRALRKMYATDMADIKSANLTLKKELATVKKDMDRLKKKAKLITDDDDEDETLR